MSSSTPAIKLQNLTVILNNQLILDKLDFEVYQGEILGLIGPSGEGKSVLMRTILGLIPLQNGSIEFFGKNVDLLNNRQKKQLYSRIGVLFQQGALFSSLNILSNVKLPMAEYLDLSDDLLNELAMLKLALVGLPANVADKYPSQLSGGMVKRVALARALALDPDIIFLDEPTSGLDPISAAQFDELIKSLSKTLGLTFYMISHDLGSLHTICDRVAVLRDKSIKIVGPLKELAALNDKWLSAYLKRQKL